MRQGTPPLIAFLSTWTRRDGVYPLSSRFYPHRHDEIGFTPSCRVSIHMDMTRWDLSHLVAFLSTRTRREGVYPVLSRFYSHKHDEAGFSPTRRVSIHADATRGGISLLVMFLFTQTQREGVYPISSCQTPFDAARRSKTRLVTPNILFQRGKEGVPFLPH
jgi:hypothetical protein